MKIGPNHACDQPPPEDKAKEVSQAGNRRPTELTQGPPVVSVKSQLGPMADSLHLSDPEATGKMYTEQQIRSTEPRKDPEVRPAREIASSSTEKLSEIRRRIEANHYDQPKVKSVIADKLIKSFSSNSE